MNSFLYEDQELLEKLIKIAQDPNAAQNPVVPTIPAGPTPQDYQLMLKLVQNLQVGKDSTLISTQKTEVAQLQVSHLKNLDSLLSFLDSEQIEVNHQRITYAVNNKPTSLDTSKYHLITLNSGKQYFIDKDLLNQYLSSLQKSNNPTVKYLLPNLLSEIQQLGITSGQQASPQQDNSQIDRMLINLASLQVLESSNVDLRRISTFVQEYSKFLAMAQNKDPNDQQNIANINNTISKLGLNSSANVFDLSSPSSIQGFLRPVPSAFTQVIWSLFDIVNLTGGLMREFLHDYGNKLQANSDALNNLSQQITGAGSPLSRNLQSLDDLKQAAKHIDTPHPIGQ